MAPKAFSYITKFITEYADSKVRSKGKQILGEGKVTLKEIDPEEDTVQYRVNSEYQKTKYKVIVFDFSSSEISSDCSCPYNWGSMCKHEVAALLHLQDYLSQNNPAAPAAVYDQQNTIFRHTDYDLHEVRYAGDPGHGYTTAQRLVKEGRVLINQALNGWVEAVVPFKKEENTVTLTLKQTNFILTSCTCTDTAHSICLHKQAVLLALLDKFGTKPFEALRDWTAEKKQLLAQYGFSLEDNITGKFDFKVRDGKLQLLQMDKALHPIQPEESWQKFNRKLTGTAQQPDAPASKTSFALPQKANARKGRAALQVRYELVYAFQFYDKDHLIPDFQLMPLSGKLNATTGELISAQDFMKATSTMPPVNEQDTELLAGISTSFGLDKFLKNLNLLRHYYHPITIFKSHLTEEIFGNIRRFLGDALTAYLPLLKGKKVYQTSPHFKPGYLEIELKQEPVQPYFVVKEQNDLVVVEPFLRLGSQVVPLALLERKSFWFLAFETDFYKIASYEDASMLLYFDEHPAIKVKQENFSGFFNGFVAPLAQAFEVDLQLEGKVETLLLTPEPRVYLKEQDEHLVLLPAFEYDIKGEKREFPADEGSSIFIEEDGKILDLQRDKKQERHLLELLRSLHPSFAEQQQEYFYLSFADAVAGGWFMKAFQTIKEHDIDLLGQKDLQGFKYNANRPSVQMRSSSGIDWFDMQMQVSFGDQTVSLKEIRKALVNKQQFVKLGDGTLGMLPEEWLEKYAKLFKHGQLKGDSLQVSKLHFSIIDELGAEIDNLELLAELHEKKQRLLNFREIKSVPLPQTLTATLRDYQHEGYKWLNFLNEYGWGGCLADDMGLGKTLQAIAFLTQQKEQHPETVSLVVVPTSLLFNWMAEAAKFSPHLRLHMYRGVDRDKNTDSFRDYDIILTTYGTLRSDIEIFAGFTFHYVVLDESQAIKNPGSLISKAVRLLKAKNRLVMTGTPIENNTFDLYSQMDFLNPGLLGSQEFFRTEFATPIDKHRSEEKAQELRKLIYPFLLRRTKAEVAKELPEKTETVLYCEMGKVQRKVYETFRKKYQQQILKQIETEGLQNSGFLILEGLLKLRQICDSPALLNEKDGSFGSASTKLEELVREIKENAGNHKMLVFSQFIGMLSLIKDELIKLGIPYAYLDGKTTDRAAQVNRFQLDNDCRIFLISLKAGGTGFNLTQAEYVYLVDPWWNPAVEAQAIDRTHRIGQTQKVFAYKMICKDSIEEKILNLQQKKQAIAGDLISTETSLLKKLDKSDIAHLFG